MALNRLERASLNRLYQNINPIDNKIKKAKDKLQKQIDETAKLIEDLETQKALYMPMIEQLEARDKESDVETLDEYNETNIQDSEPVYPETPKEEGIPAFVNGESSNETPFL